MRLRTLLVATASALALVLGTQGLASPATAASPPVVVSPAPGGTLPYGSSGPLVIDFPAEVYGYLISVDCNSYYWSTGGFVQYSGRQSIPIDPLVGITEKLEGSTCEIEISGGSPFGTTTSSFTVAVPQLKLGDVTTSRSTFYPLVKDGYRERTKFLFDVNRWFKATITIKDATSRTIYTNDTDGQFSELGEYYWPWNGKTTHGKPVLPGKYKATISVTDTDGTTLTDSTSVRVATKTVTREKTVRLRGISGRTSTSGNCNARKRDGAVILDCRGGKYAAATYAVTIPADATNVRWGAEAERTEDDLSEGTITKRGTRVAKTRFEVRIEVTGQRAVKVSEVWVSYRGTYQI